jgi:hypothetical protein
MFKSAKSSDLDEIMVTMAESRGAKSFDLFFRDRLKPHLVDKFINQIKSATDEKRLFMIQAKLQLLDDIEKFLTEQSSRQDKVERI